MNAAAPAAADTARLARALLARAHPTLRSLPAQARGPALAAIDLFLARPAPSSFLAASRALAAAQRQALLEYNGSGTLQRVHRAGLAALGAVPGLPAALAGHLAAHLPIDPRSGRRLSALAALAAAYAALNRRVAADTEDMRRRLEKFLPRRSCLPPPPRPAASRRRR